MSIEREKNKGFTLIELIIAIAMLAFLMTAVSSFMASGIMGYKKAKADIRVHNSAQENYDKISDAIMEAKDIYLFGYLDGDNKLYCFVRDEAQADNISKVSSQVGIGALASGATATAKYFDFDSYVTENGGLLTEDTNIQVVAIVIDTAAPIDSLSGLTADGTDTYKNYLVDGDKIEVKKQIREIKDADGNVIGTEDVKDSNGNQIYTVNDTVRQMFVFEKENMYYMVKYALQSGYSDNYVDAGSGAKLSDYLYSSSFDYDDNDHTKCIAHIDAKNGAMSVDLIYSDKNMTYTTQGMIRTRNSFVLKAKK